MASYARTYIIHHKFFTNLEKVKILAEIVSIINDCCSADQLTYSTFILHPIHGYVIFTNVPVIPA
jgi:hypothetical protein